MVDILACTPKQSPDHVQRLSNKSFSIRYNKKSAFRVTADKSKGFCSGDMISIGRFFLAFNLICLWKFYVTDLPSVYDTL